MELEEELADLRRQRN